MSRRDEKQVLGKRRAREESHGHDEVESEAWSSRLRVRKSQVRGDEGKPVAAKPPPASHQSRSDPILPDSSTSGESTKPRSDPTSPESSKSDASCAPQATEGESLRADIFPFMSLPAELRLRIYYMALVRHDPIALHVDRWPQVQKEPKCHPEHTPSECDLSITEDEDEDDDGDNESNEAPQGNPNLDLILQGTSCSRNGQRQHTPSCPLDADDRPPRLRDPIEPVILRLNKQIYKEAHQLLYAENTFMLYLTSGIRTLSTLHQRSRSMIKHVVLAIPSHHDILDGFADLVRLGLRYCWGLKSFRIILNASIPDDTLRAGGQHTSVYANAFHILRWLPRGCSVKLEGCVGEGVKRVVSEEGRLMNVLDEASREFYAHWAKLADDSADGNADELSEEAASDA